MTVAEIIEGRERLIEIFGQWPSFHDAEVVEMTLQRRGVDEWEGPILLARVHLFQGAQDATADDMRWTNHTVATLRFTQVQDLSLSDFNTQNGLMDLVIEPAGMLPNAANVPAYRVEFQQSFGLACRFICGSIAIADVQRGAPPGSVYA